MVCRGLGCKDILAQCWHANLCFGMLSTSRKCPKTKKVTHNEGHWAKDFNVWCQKPCVVSWYMFLSETKTSLEQTNERHNRRFRIKWKRTFSMESKINKITSVLINNTQLGHHMSFGRIFNQSTSLQSGPPLASWPWEHCKFIFGVSWYTPVELAISVEIVHSYPIFLTFCIFLQIMLIRFRTILLQRRARSSHDLCTCVYIFLHIYIYITNYVYTVYSIST